MSEPESAETIRLRRSRGLRVELDYLLPQGDPGVGPLVEDWFRSASDLLAGDFVEGIPAEGLPSGVLRDPEGGPFGPMGSRWCSLLVIRQRERRLSKSLRAWSPKNWEWFLTQGADVSVELSAKFSTLNRFGHSGVPSLTVSAYRPRPDARQWLKLDATYIVGAVGETSPIADGLADEWLDFLRSGARRSVPVFGYLADDFGGAGATRTPLEARTQRFAQETLPLAEVELRGYSWVTVTSPGVLERLGGAEAVRSTRAFAEVIELPSGGAVLQATDRLSDYEGGAVRRVFHALGPVLPDKQPWPDELSNFKLIYERPKR